VVTFINPAGGEWDTPANWSTGQLPGPTDDVVINVPGNVAITHNGPGGGVVSSDTVHSLVCNNPFLLSSLNSGSLTVLSTATFGSTVDAGGGTLTVDGTSSFAAEVDMRGTLVTNGPSSFQGLVQFTFGGDLEVNAASTFSGPVGFADVSTLHTTAATTFKGPVTLDAGSLTLDANATLDDPVLLEGGSLGGSGTVTLNGALTWKFGSIAGSGTVLANGGILLDDTATFQQPPALIGMTLENGQKALWVGSGELDVVAGGTLVNRPGATFTIQSDAPINSSDSSGVFTNQGTLVKSLTSGSTTINTAFNNSGTFDVQSGQVALDNGGDSSGSFTVGKGSTLFLSQGLFTLESSSAVSGPGSLAFGTFGPGPGPTVNVAGTLTTANITVMEGTVDFLNPVTLPTLALQGGTITGPGTVTVAGAFNWTGGTMNGTGKTVAEGPLVIDPQAFSDVRLARSLDIVKSATWTGQGLVLASNCVINNRKGSTFTIATASTFGDPTAQFNNAGALVQSITTGTATLGLPLNNTGSILVQSGTLALAGGGNDTGTFTVNAGATLSFGGPTTTLGPTSVVSGAGAVSFSAGTTNVFGHLSAAAGATINGGTVNFMNNITLPTLTLASGTLQGPGTVTVSGPLSWTGGTMSGPGLTVARGGILIDFTGVFGPPTLDGRTLDNVKTATWVNGPIQIGDGGVFDNLAGATFLVESGQLINTFGVIPGAFDNEGTVRQLANTGSSGLFSVFNNSGTVEVQGGTLGVGAGTDSGKFQVDSGATLGLGGAGGSINLAPTAQIVGAGSVIFAAPFLQSVTVAGRLAATGGYEIDSGTVNFLHDLTLPSLTLRGGTLTGPFTVTVAGLLDWQRGTMSGPGVTVAQGGLILDTSAIPGGPIILDGRTLDNVRSAVWVGTQQDITVIHGGVIDNLAGATFQIQADATVDSNGGGPGTFLNEGTLVKAVTPGTTVFGITFDNRGTVDVQSGTLRLTAGGDATGSYKVEAGTTLEFAGTFLMEPSSQISGAGTVVVSNNTTGTPIVTLEGTDTANTIVTALGGGISPTLSIPSGKVTLPSLQINGGVLTGLGSVEVTGPFDWEGGAINGQLLVRADSNLLINTATNQSFTLDGATLENVGSGTVMGSGTVHFADNAVLRNDQRATLLLPDGANFFATSFQAPGTFDNEGLLRQLGSAGTTTVSATFTNNGTLDVQGGTLSLFGGFTNLVVGQQLTGGTYQVAGTLQIGNFISANAAHVVLTGPAAQITTVFGTNALAGLARNASSGQLTLDGGANALTSRDFTNQGQLTVGAGSTFSTGGAYTQLSGATVLAGGTLTASNGVLLVGGSLSGPGTVNGNVVNEAQISPGGAGAGLLTINGDYTQTATGALDIGLGGVTAGTQYGQLAVTGTATLDGTLGVTLLNGFQPMLNDQFAVLTFGSRSGTFGKLNFPSLGGTLFLAPLNDTASLTLLVEG
jgi:hypothetical protein